MHQYLDPLRDIYENGNVRGDRTGTGTVSKFGHLIRFDLRTYFPLLTTKKVHLRGIIQELLWFLSGSTNNNDLLKDNVNIWTKWAVKERITLSLDARYKLLYDRIGEEQYALVTSHAPLAGTDELQHVWLDTQNIPRDVPGPNDGELGPIYSALWRNWDYQISTTELAHILQTSGSDQRCLERLEQLVNNAQREPIDQIKNLIDGLKTRPYSRRHIVSGWNPAVLPDESISPQANVLRGKQALAACHTLFQFYVEDMNEEELIAQAGKDLYSQAPFHTPRDNAAWLRERGVKTRKLSCLLYQRSGDFPVGIPYNIASYSLLTMMVAQCVDMVAHEFIHVFGDHHIYSDQIEGVETQLKRQPSELPTLWINPEVKDIFSFTLEDFRLDNYNPQAFIKYPVAV